MITGFAMLALVLAGIGAKASNVLALVMGDGVRMALAGIVIGVAGSAALAPGMRSLLVGVPAVDLVTMMGVAGLLAGVAVLATLLPARRATAVDPTEALRGGA